MTTHSKPKTRKPAATRKYAWGTLRLFADFAQASAPIWYTIDGDDDVRITPFQVADARHHPGVALTLVNDWLKSQ